MQNVNIELGRHFTVSANIDVNGYSYSYSWGWNGLGEYEDQSGTNFESAADAMEDAVRAIGYCLVESHREMKEIVQAGKTPALVK